MLKLADGVAQGRLRHAELGGGPGLWLMVLRFGGASGAGILSVARREAANEALKKKGEFKQGVFTYVDADGKRQEMDGSAACFVEATGEELIFA